MYADPLLSHGRPSNDSLSRSITSSLLLSYACSSPWLVVLYAVHFYTIRFGRDYFIFLNFAFYVVGFPICYIERQVDGFLVDIFGSTSHSYQRIKYCTLLMTVCIICCPYLNEGTLMLVVMAMGCCSWIAHGATARIFKTVTDVSVIHMTPHLMAAVIAAVMVFSFELVGSEPEKRNLMGYYFTSAGLVAVTAFVGLLLMGKKEDINSEYKYLDDALMSADSFNDGECSAVAAWDDLPRIQEDGDETEIQAPSQWPGVNNMGEEVCYLDDRSLSELCDKWSAGEIVPPTSTTPVPSFPRFGDSRPDHTLSGSERITLTKETLGPLRWGMFIITFSTILQGSFLSLVPASPTILVIIRTLAEPMGRVIGVYSAPKNLSGVIRAGPVLLIVACVAFNVIAFSHRILPMFSIGSRASSSAALYIVQGFISILSGGIVSCLYVHVTKLRMLHLSWQQNMASYYLYTSYQKACSIAVLAAVVIIVAINSTMG
mmetsp:Transcript_23957/g.35166  ORF Transcript_23957/g.35166 Transcript_23957/m.35166 type:complete len:487 (-) Transcript_23957:185-1645(-)